MFKIRKKIYPKTGYEICEKKYQEFLLSKQKFLSKDLFTLFQFDCFHDGDLKNLRYHHKRGYIEMTLISPNFLDDKDNYVNIAFCLKFHDIRHFKIRKNKADSSWRGAIYTHGELGTLGCSATCNSVIMQFVTPDVNSFFWIEIICRNIEIVPQDELSFQELLRTKKIRLAD